MNILRKPLEKINSIRNISDTKRQIGTQKNDFLTVSIFDGGNYWSTSVRIRKKFNRLIRRTRRVFQNIPLKFENVSSLKQTVRKLNSLE